MGWAASKVDFHIMDLETLTLLQGMPLSQNETLVSRPDVCLQASIAPQIEKLSIYLRRPLAFFRELGNSPMLASAISRSVIRPNSRSELNTSMEAGFPSLRKLLLWLDHSGIEYWSVVDERAVLGPLLTAAASYPSLEIVLVLPKTHPILENSERHFLGDDLERCGHEMGLPPAKVRRVWRQRYRYFGSHKAEDAPVPRDFDPYRQRRRYGPVRVKYVHDFPLFLKQKSCTGKDVVAMEAIEATRWRNGEDMTSGLRDFALIPEPPA